MEDILWYAQGADICDLDLSVSSILKNRPKQCKI